jgi:hypothetical protein
MTWPRQRLCSLAFLSLGSRIFLICWGTARRRSRMLVFSCCPSLPASSSTDATEGAFSPPVLPTPKATSEVMTGVAIFQLWSAMWVGACSLCVADYS